MAQLNFYVPDEVEEGIRKEAKARGKSISAYLAEVVKERIRHDKWQKDFFTKVAGGWRGECPEVDRPPPEETDFS